MELADPPRVPPFPHFTPPAWAEGFHYIRAAVSDRSDHDALVRGCRAACDATPPELRGSALEPNGRSRVALFGHDIRDDRWTPPPAWLLTLRAKLAEVLRIYALQHSLTDRGRSLNLLYVDMLGMDAFKINEYAPGDSLHMHADTYRYGDGIVTVSVGAPAKLRIDHGAGNAETVFELTMEPGDCYVLTGNAWSRCRHGIRAWPEQPGTRYSIVFRKRVWTEGERRPTAPNGA